MDLQNILKKFRYGKSVAKKSKLKVKSLPKRQIFSKFAIKNSLMTHTNNLSVPDIILYLRDIEEKLYKLPHREYQLPIYTGGEIPLQALNGEAKRIMEHVGLTMFQPNCIWTDLPNNTAGDIQLNGSRSGEINIRISEKYKNNGKATVAILAHEVCHKLLEYNGLFFPMMTDINERYTDLCTIYVGFSQLILNGYRTTVGETYSLLGYLNFNNYEQAERIIRIIFGSLQLESLAKEQSASDYEIELAEWFSLKEKRAKHLRGFANASRLYSEINRDVTILQELLEKIPPLYRDHLEKLDKSYFIDDPFEGDRIQRPIQAFTLSDPYTYGKESVKMSEEKAERVKSLLEKMIKAANSVTSSDTSQFISAHQFFCPFCGRKSEYKNDKESRILRCPSCKKAFYIKEATLELPNPISSGQTTQPKPVGFWSRIFKKNKS